MKCLLPITMKCLLCSYENGISNACAVEKLFHKLFGNVMYINKVQLSLHMHTYISIYCSLTDMQPEYRGPNRQTLVGVTLVVYCVMLIENTNSFK